jgi:hypothetical protein
MGPSTHTYTTIVFIIASDRAIKIKLSSRRNSINDTLRLESFPKGRLATPVPRIWLKIEFDSKRYIKVDLMTYMYRPPNPWHFDQ